jgi:hypothetical protein
MKSLEKELQLLQNDMQELRNIVPSANINIVEYPVDQVMMSECKTPNSVEGCQLRATSHDDEDLVMHDHNTHDAVRDDESVKSDEIMKLIADIEQDDDKTENTEHVDIVNTAASDDQVDEMSSDNLMKKTNEELKRILKERGSNTKGSKVELVNRILEHT